MNVNGMNLEDLAKMDIDQLSALEEGGEAGGDGGQQDVNGASSGAATGTNDGNGSREETAGGEGGGDNAGVTGDAQGAVDTQEEGGDAFVETKNGKGKIPYAVLQQTREKLSQLEEEVRNLREKRGIGYTVELSGDHSEQVTAVNASLSALNKQFEDGDIEWEAFQLKQSELLEQRDALRAQGLKAEIAAEIAQQSQAEAWEQAVGTFMGKAQDGVDYAADEAKRSDLDMYVKLLGNDPNNANQPYDWFLKTAHTAVLAKHGMNPAASQGQAPGNNQAPGAQVQPQGDGKAPIRSLSDIPGGILPAGSEIEQVGDMSEAALANKFMKDPAAIDRYLAALG